MARITGLRLKGHRSMSGWVEIDFPSNQPIVLFGENNAGKS